MKEKILIALPNDYLGGAEQFLKMIGEYFHGNGYEVHIYFLMRKGTGAFDRFTSPNYKLFFTTASSVQHGAWDMFKNLRKNRKHKYKYAFTSHTSLNSFIAMMRKWNVVNIEFHIARESTSIFARFSGFKLLVYRLLYVANYRKIDLLICQTDFMYNQLKEAIPNIVGSINVQVIPNPVNLNNFKHRNGEFIVPYSNYIVSAGRLIPEKGFDVLLEAFKKLKQHFPKLELVILGDGELLNNLQSQIETLGLVESVHLPGFVDNVYPYFFQSKLCVVSSRIEGFPNVLLQMMSQNETVVSTLCAGGVENLTGVLTCEPNNVDALFQTMLSGLNSNNKDNRTKFDEILKERSIDNFVSAIEEKL